MIKGEDKLKGLDKRIIDCVYAHHENTKNQYDTIVIFGYRSVEEQNELYAQGRTKPGNKVTNAKGGQSAHNFHAGVDLVGELINDKDKQPEWTDMDYFLQLKQEAEKRGLKTLWSIGDFGHVECPDFKKLKI